MRILHIEDDVQLAKSIARALTKLFQAEVFTIDTADGAIELLKTNQYDLVISDYDLRIGTGGDVLQWVKDNRPDQRWLFLAGNEAIESLGVPYVSKPAPMSEVRSAIEDILS